MEKSEWCGREREGMWMGRMVNDNTKEREREGTGWQRSEKIEETVGGVEVRNGNATKDERESDAVQEGRRSDGAAEKGDGEAERRRGLSEFGMDEATGESGQRKATK